MEKVCPWCGQTLGSRTAKEQNRTEQTLRIVRDVARFVLCVCVGLTGESCQNGRTDRDGVCRQTRVDPWFSHTAVRRADH